MAKRGYIKNTQEKPQNRQHRTGWIQNCQQKNFKKTLAKTGEQKKKTTTGNGKSKEKN